MWCIAASLLLSAPPSSSVAPEKVRVLITDLSTQGVAPEVAKLAVGILSTAVADLGGFTPVTMQDLRNMVQLEGNREELGCNVDSCLADVASAMDSRFVIYGEIGSLDTLMIINLNLYDAAAASSIARYTARVTSAGALPDVLPHAVRELFGGLAGRTPAQRSLVVAGAVVLGAGAVVGVGAGVGAAVASGIAGNPAEAYDVKHGAIGVGRWLLGGVGAGVAAAAVGGVLLGLGLAGGGE